MNYIKASCQSAGDEMFAVPREIERIFRGGGGLRGNCDFERRFLSLKGNIIPVIFMQMKAIYRDHVLKPLTKLDLPEETTVHIIVR